mmetsp:Transcript_99618/g.192365  ORF Transcript_99618/g.192365 Transcript_99618/m.192365 type:complete len:224 (-) Transcript_99618:6-677(-)
MPGGDWHYHGIGAYIRRCTFLYATGSAALLVAYPFDVAYTCLAADTSTQRRFRGTLHFVTHTYQTHGMLSLYRGLPLCLATAAPFVLVATAVHDFLAPVLLRRRGQAPCVGDPASSGDPEWLLRDGAPVHLYPWNLWVGAVSGFAGQAVTYPLDTLRRRWQHTCTSQFKEHPATLRQCLVHIRSQGGYRVLYAGFSVNALKLLPELWVLGSVYLTLNASGSFV